MEAKTGNREDAALLLATNIASVCYEDIPKEAVEASKKSILDTLGVILGASGTVSGCRELVELIKEAGGKQESTIIGFGGKVPAWMAAFANGGMAHGLDYDDVFLTGGVHPVHPSACVVPAAFATAERVGGVNGRDFITAVTLGKDMACRMGLAIAREYDYGWHVSPVFGAFSCAAASGKLLGLDQARLVDAFGIALCQAACTTQLNVGLGSNLRGLYPGFAAKAGVLSACMAQKGIDGSKNSLEGNAGLYPVYFRGKYNREAILTDLGKRFEGVDIRFKPWPACGFTHPYIEATLTVVNQKNIHPEEIEQVTVFVGDEGRLHCEPLEARRKPTTTLDAKFSIPFTVAVAIAKRNVRIADYTMEGLKDPLVLQVAEKAVVDYSERFDRLGDTYSGQLRAGEVEIRTKEGGAYRKRVDIPYGHPRKPMSMEAVVEKFRECACYSAKPLPRESVEQVIEAIAELEKVANVAEIVQQLS